jgi:transposase
MCNKILILSKCHFYIFIRPLMKAPTHLDFSPEQIEALIERLDKQALAKEDYPVLTNLIKAIVWMNFSLQEKRLSIQRLRSIFGIKTESAKNLAKFMAQAQAAEDETSTAASNKTEEQSAAPDQNGEPAEDPNASTKKNPPETKGKHGHRPASDYTQAKIIDVAHEFMKKGSPCPSCDKGKLFNLSPGTVLRIVGQPWLQVEIYRPERLRCAVCGKVFTATLPPEVVTQSRADSSAKAIVSLLKYRGGVPFYRQGQIQEILGTPISPSEIWEMTEDVADAVQPVYALMCEHASAAELVQNDDTKARILSVMKDREERKGTAEEDERTGIFTTAILGVLQNTNVKIALFFTGVKHAGENLDDLLNKRPKGLSAPIQQCDGGHNVPEHHDTNLSNCNAHSRRKFYELVITWPKIVVKIIGWYSIVFANERLAPSDPLLRLKWHQDHSAPAMQHIKSYCDALMKQKEIEPNSSMGKAIAYLNNHWEELTLFLRMPGVPIDNNATERLIKQSVRNRKNAYFYRNETGAKIGDILMSVMETCVLNDANPWEYLVAIQEYQKDVRKNPALWVPWAYEKRLNELKPPTSPEVLQQ